MARKNKTPLNKKQTYQTPPFNQPQDNLLDGLDVSFDTQFDPDKALGLATSAIQPKGVDNTAIDKEIAALEKPASGSVYDKMAARYRSQGEAKVLRTQKNLNNLFSPTITLIKEREAAAQARFTLLKDKMPEFDDSTIFGNQSGNEMPIKDYVMDVSKSVKEDLRMLSRLNPNDERYDEIKKRVDKNQKAIVDFDDINQQLLKIRNTDNDESQWSAGMDQTTADMWRDIYSSKGENIKIVDGKLVWTDTRSETSYEFKGGSWNDDKLEALGGGTTDLGKLALWTRGDAGEQLEFENGKKSGVVEGVQKALIQGGFTDADGNELDPDGEWGDKSQAAYDKYLEQKNGLENAYLDENLPEDSEYRKTSGTGGTRTIDLSQIGDGPTMIDNKGLETDIEIQDAVQGLINSNIPVDDPRYDAKVNQLVRKLNSAGPKGIKSLIFDGIDGDPTNPLASTNTDAFIEDVIRYNHGENLSEAEIDKIIDGMRDKDVTFSYKNSEGKDETLQSQYIKWYRKQIDLKVKEGKKSKLVASSGGGGDAGGGGDKTTTTTETNTNENDNFSAPFIERFGGDSNLMFSELTEKGAFGIDKDNILFNYDDSDYAGYNEGGLTVANKLNESYGVDLDTFGDLNGTDVGSEGQRMSFYFEEVGSMDDVIRVHYRTQDGSLVVKDYEIDNFYDDSDEQSATKMQKDMRELVDIDMKQVKASKGANEVYVGEEGGDYNAETETETETEPKSKNEIIKGLKNIEVDEGLLSYQDDPSNYTDIDGSKVSFFVQIGVFGNDVNDATLNNINAIGGAEKIPDKGNYYGLYKYIAGSYNSLSEAEFRKSEVSQYGFSDSVIIAIIDGKIVKVEDAVAFLNK